MKFLTIVGLAAFAKAEFFGCPGASPLSAPMVSFADF